MPPRSSTRSARTTDAAANAPATPAGRRTEPHVENEAVVDAAINMPIDPEPAGHDEPAEGYASEKDDDAPGALNPLADGALPRFDPDGLEDEEQEQTLDEAEEALGDDVAIAVAGTAPSADIAAQEAIKAHRAEKGYEAPTKTQKGAEAKLATAARKEWVEAQWVLQEEATGIEPPTPQPVTGLRSSVWQSWSESCTRKSR